MGKTNEEEEIVMMFSKLSELFVKAGTAHNELEIRKARKKEGAPTP